MAMLAQAFAGRPRFSKHTLNVTGANEFRRLDNTGIVFFSAPIIQFNSADSLRWHLPEIPRLAGG